MRSRRAFRPSTASPRLATLRAGDRTELWTETAGRPPAIYGERWVEWEGRTFRSFEPARSKLSAAVVKEWAGPLPRPGESWLYLGAASGTTASHVADLLGPSGRVYAVERSLRPFGRLLGWAPRWPGVFPVLADARQPTAYSGLVRPVQGLYADVAQPDQVEIVAANALLLLEGPRGAVLVALKTASMGRDRTAAQHVRAAEDELGAWVDLEPSVRLDPFHRGHYLVGGTVRPGALVPGGLTSPRRPPGRSPGRRRP
jgi:fibrillarin-like pre-rRNA processing protein